MTQQQTAERQPEGELSVKLVAMPANANPAGDIFGGWVVANMDMAAATFSIRYCKKRVVTVAIDSMCFKLPVKVGDALCCYVSLLKLGRTSMRLKVETWAVGRFDSHRRLVTEGEFTMVAVNEQGRPVAVKD